MDLFKRQINLILLLITLIFTLYNTTIWQSAFLGWILFFLYLILVGTWWQDILYRVFGIIKKTFLSRILAWFVVFSLLGLVASVDIVFYKLTPLLVWSLYLEVAILTFVIHFLFKRWNVRNKEIKEVSANKNLIVFSNSIFLLLGYITFWVLGLILLLKSNGTGESLSPWQTINHYYLPVFFVLTVLSGVLLFSKYKTKVLLFIFVLQSLLLHLYVPLSHEMPWGGDVWRHLAVENQLQVEQVIPPVLFGEEASWREFAGIDLPDVLFVPQKYSYGHMWGTSVFLSETLGSSLMQINIWLVPVVWGLVVPFLFFRIGCLLFDSQRKGLWLTWLSFLPASLQAFGGQTLPVSFGFILFLFVLMLWLQYWRDNNKYQKYLALFFSFLMLFGYLLYFALIWVLIILTPLLRRLLESKKLLFFKNKHSLFNKISLGGILLVSMFIIPVIEILGKISFIPRAIAWVDNIKQFVGQFLGWFYASMIRPHDIISGNFLFNHTPSYAFVENIFNSWRWWLIPVMCLVWLIFKFSAWQMFVRDRLAEKIILLLTFISFGGYIIGWFVLQGDKLFTRRLDLVLAFLIVTFLSYGLLFFVQKINWKQTYFKIFILIFILCFSWFTTFTYSSGPDGRVVSRAEYDVANYVWDNRQISDFPPLRRAGRFQISMNDKSCVLGDTWLLLVLEGISSGQIIGGGFPMDYQFGQVDRVRLFDKMTHNPEDNDLVEMYSLTNSDSCWFIQKSELFTEANLDKVNQIFKSEPEMMDGFFIWQMLENGGEIR